MPTKPQTELKEALKDLLYMAEELTRDGLIDHAGEECECEDESGLCDPVCRSCGCVWLKIVAARAALKTAE